MMNTKSFADADVVFLPNNEVYATVRCPRHIAYELSEQFVFKAENYKFHPKYKKRLWDGNIHLFPKGSDKIYIGLIGDAIKYCDKAGYSVYVHPELNRKHQVSKPEIKEFLNGLNLYANGQPIHAKDYQIDAIWQAVNRQRMIVKSPTGSGKSLIIYSIIRWFEDKIDNKKQLVIVPTISLVSQMASDFADYSLNGVSERIYQITGGVDKEIPANKDIVITTWQSITNMEPEWYDQFHVMVCDEAHQYKATSLKSIAENAKNTPVKIGTTGTTGKKLVNVMTLKALFGDIISFTSTKKLMDRKDLAQMEIHAFVLNYPDEMGKELRRQIREEKKKPMTRQNKGLAYQLELQMVYNSSLRMKFLAKVVKSTKEKNCLILFDRTEYGKKVFEELQRVFPNKQFFYIDKDVKKKEREEIRNYMEQNDNCVLVASYGTTSTGVNIRNLPFVVLASPTKSLIRLLQSIGRGLRKHENKDKLILVDMADNFSTKSKKNYGIKHLMERLSVYSEEGFDFKIREVNL